MGSRWQTGVVHSPSSWRARLAKRIDPATVRNRVENVNDGILAIAGALSVARVVLSAGLADRDAELLVAA